MKDDFGDPLIQQMTMETLQGFNQEIGSIEPLPVVSNDDNSQFNILKFIIDKNVEYSVGSLCCDNMVLRLPLNGRAIDFPTNWSIFKFLKDDILLKQNSSFFLLSKGQDVDGVFEIINEGKADCSHLGIFCFAGKVVCCSFGKDQLKEMEEINLHFLKMTYGEKDKSKVLKAA